MSDTEAWAPILRAVQIHTHGLTAEDTCRKLAELMLEEVAAALPNHDESMHLAAAQVMLEQAHEARTG